MGGPGGPAAQASPIRGRTQITGQALNRLAGAVAATHLVVPVAQVKARVSDDHGALGIALTAPISVAPLSNAAIAETLLQRAERLRAAIGQGVTDLSGRQVGSVALHLTSAHLRTERRVT